MRLVRAVAHDVARRVPRTDFDELVSAGTVGLMRAVERYDAARGVAFTTYAVALIRGAILDDLRSQAWSTRTARSRARRITIASHQLAGRLGRGPAAREVAEHLGIDLGTYFEWQHAAEACRVVRFGPGDSASAPLEDRLADDAAVAPDEALEWEETVGELRGAVAGLSPKQRRVISLYFKDQLTLREIGGLMGVSEGRVSQIRKAALRALRLSLAAAPTPDRKPDREGRADARVRHQKLPADAIQKGA
jgi:RNA polymerase sigma factor for flagellar operon FliA